MVGFIEPVKLAVVAQQKKQEYRKIASHLRKKKPSELDTVVHQWDEELFEEIDCLKCANCCRSLGPRITMRDISRIAKYLGMKDQEFIKKYLRIDEDGDYVFQSMPCPFLMEDNYCMVYDKRPKACRDYPHTHQIQFHKQLSISVKNTATCPAVYHIFERLLNKYRK